MGIGQRLSSLAFLFVGIWLLCTAIVPREVYAQTPSPCQEDGGSMECIGFIRLKPVVNAFVDAIPDSCKPPATADDLASGSTSIEGALFCAFPTACRLDIGYETITYGYGYNQEMVSEAHARTYWIRFPGTDGSCNGSGGTASRDTSLRWQSLQACPPDASVASWGAAPYTSACTRPLQNCNRCDKGGPPVGNPISTDSGNKWLEETDYRGVGELAFVRTYNSQTTFVPRTGTYPVNAMGTGMGA